MALWDLLDDFEDKLHVYYRDRKPAANEAATAAKMRLHSAFIVATRIRESGDLTEALRILRIVRPLTMHDTRRELDALLERHKAAP